MGVHNQHLVFSCLLSLVYGSHEQCPIKKLVTFNAGLQPSTVKYYEDRRQLLVPALKNLGSDVICLQEVFYGKDVKETVHRLMFTYPYSYSSLHDSHGRLNYSMMQKAPCQGTKSMQFLTCFSQKCNPTGRPLLGVLECALKQCKMLELSDFCITCILVSGPENISNHCLGPQALQMNIPGLLVLSRRKLWSPKRTPFIHGVRPFFRKEFITARVQELGEIMCTHLTPANDTIAQAFQSSFFADGETENLFETISLLRRIRNEKDIVLMGDMNSGPSISIRHIHYVTSASFEQFMKGNLRSPYAELVGKPTYSPHENTLTDGHDISIIDHILTRGYKILGAKRVIDQLLPEKKFPLSDHYGAEISVRTNCRSDLKDSEHLID
ncbi:uncharacterized protein LOC127712346 isoform X1 [Mytilus californianus]|uniref:uncharacterized protein LOC127712346 isoform X1 n=1 Tax=Mytilus californianus TaxID=6549 RepID=UPI0022459A28|nr:uncharacterized protein LOC127712346 isoform X1 [Mytilus californianus]